MKMTKKKLILTTILFLFGVLLGSFSLQSCRQMVRDIGHGLGAITLNDIDQAKNYEKLLVPHLNNTALVGHKKLTEKQLKVDAGSGTSHVNIYDYTDETAKEKIRKNLEVLNQKNPQLNPLKVNFR